MKQQYNQVCDSRLLEFITEYIKIDVVIEKENSIAQGILDLHIL